jgi:hypothetical protein
LARVQTELGNARGSAGGSHSPRMAVLIFRERACSR